LMVFCAYFLVQSMLWISYPRPGFTPHLPLPFIGLVLLPLLANVSEQITAAQAAYHDKLILSLGMAVSNATQVLLLIIPGLVLLGWCIDQPLTLVFTTFQAIVLLGSLGTVNYIYRDGQSNWFLGCLLMCAYAIFGFLSYYQPV